MSRDLEQLTKLGPKTQNLQPIGKGGKSEDTSQTITGTSTRGGPNTDSNVVDRYDVAAALGMGNLDQIAYNLALAKYTHDMRATYQLRVLLLEWVTRLSTDVGWDPDPQILTGMVDLAVAETVRAGTCKLCRGTGYNSQHKPCRRCKGTGKEPKPSGRSMARHLNLSEATWRRIWKKRYKRLENRLAHAEVELMDHLGTHIGN